ncbi:hypothetical protein MKW98_027952 [Papaver atlanticum]|uniref:Uncharacterized protein n=1 Tax=Papaver atlanticum TaxID=357466 RepID=A0AAD4SNK4_9MAGN|nr:hypothetical protein MKW98_027952 [Papaver atlanticum]
MQSCIGRPNCCLSINSHKKPKMVVGDALRIPTQRHLYREIKHVIIDISGGLFKRDAKRKANVIEARTRVDQAECSCEGKAYFLAIWTENKKYQL